MGRPPAPGPKEIYRILFGRYGPQGWWPLLELSHRNTNPTGRGSMRGYHPGDYSYPRTDAQKFEIMVGAVLTQNTSWVNVEKALYNLAAENMLEPDALLRCDTERLAALIRPSGYYNQKAIKLKNLARFIVEEGIPEKIDDAENFREKLMEIKGVGPETADSILLYALHIPTFVADTYARRLVRRTGLMPSGYNNYEKVRSFFMEKIPPDEIIYNEFHALIVKNGVIHCKKTPICKGCPLEGVCPKIGTVPSKRSHRKVRK